MMVGIDGYLWWQWGYRRQVIHASSGTATLRCGGVGVIRLIHGGPLFDNLVGRYPHSIWSRCTAALGM